MIRVMEHRTRVDYAHFMKELTQQYPGVESIRLVQDNSIRILQAHFIMLLRLKRRLSWLRSSNIIIRQRKVAGSTWLR